MFVDIELDFQNAWFPPIVQADWRDTLQQNDHPEHKVKVIQECS